MEHLQWLINLGSSKAINWPTGSPTPTAPLSLRPTHRSVYQFPVFLDEWFPGGERRLPAGRTRHNLIGQIACRARMNNALLNRRREELWLDRGVRPIIRSFSRQGGKSFDGLLTPKNTPMAVPLPYEHVSGHHREEKAAPVPLL